MLVDTHCHIHAKDFYSDDRQEVYQRAVDAGVKMICVGTDQADSQQVIDFTADRPGTYPVIGVHPHEAKFGCDTIRSLAIANRQRLVGIGEIGLDYFYSHSPREAQIDVFGQQLQIASDLDLPVSFHVRDAFDDFWPIFESFSGLRGVLHSFTDNQASLERALTNNLMIGVNGISTFTKDDMQRQMFDAVPLENMLLETDAPFLTPTPLRGKINEPIYVRQVAEYHAKRRGIELDQLVAQTSENAHRLFAI